MSYPSLALCSDPNEFSILAHASVSEPPFNGGPYAATCVTSKTPDMFWRLGQRRAICNDPRFLPTGSTGLQKCVDNCPAPNFPGALTVSLGTVKPVDDLTGYFCGYQRNARYVGNYGGVIDGAAHYTNSLN